MSKVIKKISVICDYCNKECQKSKYKYEQARKVIAKNCCSNVECLKLKRTDVMMLKHGVATAGHLPQSKPHRTPEEQQTIDAKRLVTIRERYGVDNVFQLQSIKDKIEATSIEKYGTSHPMESDAVKSILRESMLSKYGVEHALQIEEVKNQARKTTLERHGDECYANTQEFRDLMKGRRKLINGKTYSEIATETGKAYSTIVEQIVMYGYEHAVSISKRVSAIELKFEDWLKSEGIQYQSQKTIDRYRPDFIIDNLIIELNGNYWHSDSVQKNDRYHVEKRSKYNELGYQSIFFAEDEIRDKFDIVCSIVRNKLKKCTKVFARKCSIIELTKKEANVFFTKNHLMGSGSGEAFGLKHENDIVAAIRIINKEDCIHVSRFATSQNMSITGGFSKLLKVITNKYKKTVINFVDLRYGSGKHLERYGFHLKSKHLSFNWTDYKNRYHRMKFKSDSGYSEGLHKIWDCGQAKYVLEVI